MGIVAGMDRVFGAGNGNRREIRNLAGDFRGAGERVIGHFVDQTEMECLVGRDYARANHKLKRASDPDQPRQALGAAAAWKNAEFDFRKPVAIITLLADPQVARQAEFKPPRPWCLRSWQR